MGPLDRQLTVAQSSVHCVHDVISSHFPSSVVARLVDDAGHARSCWTQGCSRVVKPSRPGLLAGRISRIFLWSVAGDQGVHGLPRRGGTRTGWWPRRPAARPRRPALSGRPAGSPKTTTGSVRRGGRPAGARRCPAAWLRRARRLESTCPECDDGSGTFGHLWWCDRGSAYSQRRIERPVLELPSWPWDDDPRYLRCERVA
jgi:hypothetical protein